MMYQALADDDVDAGAHHGQFQPGRQARQGHPAADGVSVAIEPNARW